MDMETASRCVLFAKLLVVEVVIDFEWTCTCVIFFVREVTRWGTGFRSGPATTIPGSEGDNDNDVSCAFCIQIHKICLTLRLTLCVLSKQYDRPHVIMSFAALLSLAILRDDFSKLDRHGMRKFLKNLQQDDGR